ncbi:MAG: MFS transporter, partial [Planctomycetaceae bacterium]
SVFRDDAGFRGVCVTAMLFMSAVLLFPHYQALARERLDSANLDLMIWVIVQNAGTGIFGLASGWLADRCGNRLVVRLLIFAAALVPLTALVLTHLDTLRLYGLVFFGLGLTPVVMRTLSNYSLEFAAPAEHPRYLSTLRLAMAVPFLLSPLVGWLVDAIGFAPVFLAVAAAIAAAGLLTFRLHEPRHAGGSRVVTGEW